jgi:hypothetical protein
VAVAAAAVVSILVPHTEQNSGSSDWSPLGQTKVVAMRQVP